jgi:hypothetical protein
MPQLLNHASPNSHARLPNFDWDNVRPEDFGGDADALRTF